jgi:hypothetical protein
MPDLLPLGTLYGYYLKISGLGHNVYILAFQGCELLRFCSPSAAVD